MGKIQLIIKDADAVTQKTVDLGRNILLGGPNLDADLNEDGISDPLFLCLNNQDKEDTLGNRIRVNLWLIKEENSVAPMMVNNKTDRVLINPQHNRMRY